MHLSSTWAEVAEVRKRLNVENSFVILYDGWLIRNNGLEELFDVLEKLAVKDNGFVAVLCGEGQDEKEFKEIVCKKICKNM